MFDQILFPTDGSDPAAEALAYVMDIAAEHESEIHVLNVADTSELSLTRIGGEVRDVQVTEGEKIVAEAASRIEERDLTAVTEVQQGDPHESIISYAEEYDVDCIIIPTHGRSGLKRTLIGSVTERVINTAPVPVFSINPEGGREPTYPCKRILVPFDGSAGATLALERGIAVGSATGATLHLIHAVETASLGFDTRSLLKEDELTDRGETLIEDAVETAREAGIEDIETEVVHGRPTTEILSYIEANVIDLAVMGTHGETNFSRYMFGGVSAKIVRSSPVPVLWVRDETPDES
jgi:nucleotide-binding universal stress UspA family protein